MIAIDLIKAILEDQDQLGFPVSIMLDGKLIPITETIDIIEDEHREFHVVLTVNTGESQ